VGHYPLCVFIWTNIQTFFLLALYVTSSAKRKNSVILDQLLSHVHDSIYS